jgi:SAM-dependent methyltransferase
MDHDASAMINREAWDRQARLALPDDHPMDPAARVEWTQYPGYGPGTELFGELSGLTVAELGCGNGDNLPPLAARGAHCIGIDIAPTQITRAHSRWGHLPIQFRREDARDFLTIPGLMLDVCFSIFGAVGLCPPAQLLPIIAERLTPGGRLLFSVPHPRWLGPRRDRMLLADGHRVSITRWTSGSAGWRAAVQAAGFTVTSVVEADGPDGIESCCIIVTAQRA